MATKSNPSGLPDINFLRALPSGKVIDVRQLASDSIVWSIDANAKTRLLPPEEEGDGFYLDETRELRLSVSLQIGDDLEFFTELDIGEAMGLPDGVFQQRSLLSMHPRHTTVDEDDATSVKAFAWRGKQMAKIDEYAAARAASVIVSSSEDDPDAEDELRTTVVQGEITEAALEKARISAEDSLNKLSTHVARWGVSNTIFSNENVMPAFSDLDFEDIGFIFTEEEYQSLKSSTCLLLQEVLDTLAS